MERTVPSKTMMLNRKAEKELAEEYKDEIDSWLSLNPDSDGDQQNDNGYSCREADSCLDLKGYNSRFENDQYQVGYDPQQCHGIFLGNAVSERLVTFPLVGASEQQQEQQYWKNYNSGMQYEMGKARSVHNPSRSQRVRS